MLGNSTIIIPSSGIENLLSFPSLFILILSSLASTVRKLLGPQTDLQLEGREQRAGARLSEPRIGELPRINSKMYQPQYFLFSLLAIFSTSNAWLYSTTNVDLSSPPPITVGDEVVDGQKVPNYNTSPWPCADYPVPGNVTRTPFPIFGGRFSFSLTNNSVGSLPNFQYEGDAYFGQVSLGDGTYSGASNNDDGGNSGFGYIDTYTWSDFSTSQDCSWEVEVVRVISEALGKDVDELTVADVVGLNATVGMRIVLFGPNPLVTDQGTANNAIEQMYQVCRDAVSFYV